MDLPSHSDLYGMFSGIMNATSYGDILSASLLPLVRNTYPDNPKHTFKFIQIFFLQNGINWWKSPAESPYLYPINNDWGSMKTYLCDKYKPRSLPELKEGIRAYWAIYLLSCVAGTSTICKCHAHCCWRRGTPFRTLNYHLWKNSLLSVLMCTL